MSQREWEITGHVTPYSFTAPNLAVAAAVVLRIGKGNLGVRQIGGDGEAMPGKITKVQVNAWAKRHFGLGIRDMERKVAQYWITEYINALESVQIGMPGDAGLVTPSRCLVPVARRAAEEAKHALVKRLHEQGPAH